MLFVLLLCLALGIRLWFAANEPGDNLYWDEDHYDFTAKAYARAWHAIVGDESAGEAWRTAFTLSRQKGEVYAIFVGLLYALTDSNPTAVFISQALLDSLTCLFLYFITRRLAGTGAALLALGFAVFYEPFTFSVGRLQTETVASFLLVGGLAALLADRCPRARHLVAGAVLAAAILVKPAFKFLWLLWAPFALYGFRPERRGREYRNTLFFALGFLLIVGPRLAFTYSLFGQAAATSDLDPGVHVYAGVVPEDRGWRTMGYQPSGELLKVLGSSARNPTSADYWHAAVRTWVFHPVASAVVALHKLYRAWLHPYNDSSRRLLLDPSILQRLHGLLLLLGLLGFPLVLRRGAIGCLLGLTAAYLWGNYLAIAIEVRYAVTAMPLMLCFAAVACIDLHAGWNRTSRLEGARVIMALVGAVLILVALQELTIGRLLQAPLGGLSPGAAHALRTAAHVAVAMIVAGAALQLLRHVMSTLTAGIVVLLWCTLVIATVITGAVQTEEWREWRVGLATGGNVALQEIDIQPGTEIPVHLNLMIDVKRTCDAPFDLVVDINDREVHRFEGELGNPTNMLLRLSDFGVILRAQRRPPEAMAGWRMIRLDPGWVKESALRIALKVENGPPGVECVELFGDYQDDPATYVGPAVISPWRQEHSSIYRYLVAGDDRMRRQTELGAQSHGLLREGGRWSDDLSPDAGLQTGRFRMFLVLMYTGSRSVF